MTEPDLTGLSLTSVDPTYRESGFIGQELCKERRKASTKEYRIVTSNRASTTILPINSSSITALNKYPIFSVKIVENETNRLIFQRDSVVLIVQDY